MAALAANIGNGREAPVGEDAVVPHHQPFHFDVVLGELRVELFQVGVVHSVLLQREEVPLKLLPLGVIQLARHGVRNIQVLDREAAMAPLSVCVASTMLPSPARPGRR